MIRVHISLCTLFTTLFGCSTTLAAPPEGKPVLVPMWKKTTVGISESLAIRGESQVPKDWFASHYANSISERKKAGRPLIPPAHPVGVGNLVFLSNDESCVAYALRQLTDISVDPLIKPGECVWYWERDCSFSMKAREPGLLKITEDWIRQHEPDALAELIFNRSLSYAFTISYGHIHFTDELAMLPPMKQLRDDKFRFGGFTEAIKQNHVKGINIETGKTMIGLPSSWTDTNNDWRRLFLGVPLASKDHWILLFERDKSVRVCSVSWQKWRKLFDEKAGRAVPDYRLWDTELLTAPTSVVADPHRRIHAIHLVENKGLIICPTHLGRVVAVDSKTGKIQWTHEYAPLDAKRFPTFAPEWVVVPPVVAGDKYIYAPADFSELLCLNVADGKKVWSVKKEDGLYPAVVGEQVLVIGEKTLRSLNLKDGSEQWKLDLPGLPCGRGAMLGDKYLLPFSEPKTWKGMIAIVDLKAGKITEVLKPEKDEPIGNLVVHQEFLISQTLTEIAVFPIRK